MKDTRWIYEKKSRAKGHEGEVVSYQVRIKTPDGEMATKTFSLKDYTNKRQALQDAIDYRDNISYKKKHNLMAWDEKKDSFTVQELYDEIPSHYDLKRGTLIKYKKLFSKYIADKFANKDIRIIKDSDVLASLKKCSRTCGSETISDVKTVWHKIFSVAILEGVDVRDWTLLITNPKSKAERTKRSKAEKNITQEDFDEFISYLKEYGHYTPDQKEQIYFRQIVVYILQVMRIAGIRPQEVKALKRADIHFCNVDVPDESGKTHKKRVVRLHIHHSVGSTDEEAITIREPKTVTSERVITVDGAKLFDEILAYSKHDVLFADYTGKLISADKLSNYICHVKRYIKSQYGKEYMFYPYLLRHSFVTDLTMQGVNPSIIREVVGHKPGSAVTDMYVSPSEEIVTQSILNRKFKE